MASNFHPRFYFDFVSPYSYLASELLHRRPELVELEVDCRPVALGTVFSRLGVRPPGEVEVRRRAALADVLLLAEHYGLPLVGPPAHPFNSIYALRSVCAVDDPGVRRRLARLFFQKSWGEGRSLEDLDLLRALIREAGLDFDPEDAATSAGPRARLKSFTAELLEVGGFGVPACVVGDRLFFGHDRLDLMVAFVKGRLTFPESKMHELMARRGPR